MIIPYYLRDSIQGEGTRLNCGLVTLDNCSNTVLQCTHVKLITDTGRHQGFGEQDDEMSYNGYVYTKVMDGGWDSAQMAMRNKYLISADLKIRFLI